MTYHFFLKAVETAVKKQADPGMSVSAHTLPGNRSHNRDGISIQADPFVPAPVIELTPYYQKACMGVPIDSIACEILNDASQLSRFQTSFCAVSSESWISDFSNVSDKILFRLVSLKYNDFFLSQVPWLPFLDLAVIFYLITEETDERQASLLIRQEHADLWDTNAKELFRLASENTPRLLPASVRSLEDTLLSYPASDLEKLLEKEALSQLSDGVSPNPLYVLSNTSGLHGAACILYPGLLKNFAERIGDDLLIFPSSIHEVLLSPVKNSPSVSEINEIIQEINALEVSVSDQLSDHVYYYNAAKGRLLIPVTASETDGTENPL